MSWEPRLVYIGKKTTLWGAMEKSKAMAPLAFDMENNPLSIGPQSTLDISKR